MKNIFFLSVCLLIINISQLSAQSFGGMIAGARDYERKVVIDTCRLRIIYDYRFSKDTLKNSQPRKDMTCIEIGDNLRHYYSIYADRYDSIVYVIRMNPEKFRPKNPHADGFIPSISHALKLYSGENPQYENVFIDYPQKGIVTMNVRYNTTDYIYEEPIEKIIWDILPPGNNSILNILGYDCLKATCSFRGRNYEAWFTQDIPIHAGPWKLSGLPGTILRANDTDNLFQWEAVGIEAPTDRLIYGYEGDSMPLKDKTTDVIKDPDIVKKVTKKDVERIRKLSWSDPITLLTAHGVLSGQLNFFDGEKMTIINPGELNYPYIPPLELE